MPRTTDKRPPEAAFRALRSSFLEINSLANIPAKRPIIAPNGGNMISPTSIATNPISMDLLLAPKNFDPKTPLRWSIKKEMAVIKAKTPIAQSERGFTKK